MIPSDEPRGLCVTAAMFLCASVNCAGEALRAAVADQLKSRNVDRMSQMAASATASVHAAAALQ
jgi:hypothetical protein